MFNEVCLIGNPNCGKTTLFNLLTGKNERVGNRAGVSVESKVAPFKRDKRILITDLPGTYSLKALSDDERVVRDYLANFSGVIVSVIDGVNFERGLKLAAEVTRLNKPMVIAINFCDDMARRGIKADIFAIEKAFGIKAVLISARKNIGIEKLIAAIGSAKVPNAVALNNQDRFIGELYKRAITFKPKAGEDFTDKADKILLSRYFGIPIFALIMIGVYSLTAVVGGFFGDKIAGLIDIVAENTRGALTARGAAEWFTGLISGAIIKGVGEVLSFLPQILALFFMLSIMEETGYMSRAAFLFDGIMEKVGLGGKSLIALGVSCGCSVSGIMTARTVESENAKRLTVYLTPFMPCGAKTAVFAWLSGLMFGGNPLITASLYFLSLFSVVFFGAVLHRFKRFGGGAGLIMEIPVMRFPSFRAVVGALKEKTADFILKAGSVIFIVSVAVWFLQSFGINGYTTEITQSFLYLIGSGIKFIFIPLGLGGWEISVAIMSSAFAKEAVIETLTMLSDNPAALFQSGYSAYAFMALILLMPPCTAALITAKRELKSNKDFLLMVLFQFSAAYLTAFTINFAGFMLENYRYQFLSLTTVGFGLIISVIILKKCGRKKCKNCPICGGKKCREKKVSTTI